LHQVQDVKARVKGAFPTLMHYGDIHIQTAGEKENFFFKSISHPYWVSKMIVNLHESHVEQRFREFENLVEEGANENQVKKVLEKTKTEKEEEKNEAEKNEATDITNKTTVEELEDIGSFSVDVFSRARKNTKKLIRDAVDGSRGETNSMNVSDEIEKEEKNMVLKDLNKDKDKAKTQSDIEVKIVGDSKTKNNNSNLESGELHENEETDI